MALTKSVNPDVDQIISDCTLAFTLLSELVAPDSLWSVNYDWQVWWSDEELYNNSCYYVAGPDQISGSFDAGFGPQTVPNTDGTVIAYTHSMAAYLAAVGYLLAVGGALDPQFLTKYAERLNEIADGLMQKHETAMSGIVELLQTNWTDPGLSPWICACQGHDPSVAKDESSQNKGIRLVYTSPIDLTKSLPSVIGAIFEYGAVERFSGYSSVGDTYQISTTSAVDNYGQDPKIYNKLRVRCCRRVRDAYRNTGLRTAWQVVNRVRSLVGEAPLPKPTFTWQDGSNPKTDLVDWSLRQVAGLARLPFPAKLCSMRGLANLMIHTQPFDTPYTNAPPGAPVSFRQLLENFSD